MNIFSYYKTINNYFMLENQISYQIRGAIYKVYNTLGPGLLERIYEKALAYELRKAGLHVKEQEDLHVIYEGEDLGIGLRLDLIVEDSVIIEVKSKEDLIKLDHKQLITYLRVTNKRLGILVNFNVDNINDGIFRKANGMPLFDDDSDEIFQ
jgi:GxxExxY protein